MLNLEDYSAETVSPEEMALEDRWILSRLAGTAQQVTNCYETYQFADAVRAVYDFAWDEFCSFYVEILKERFHDPQSRPVAQRMITYVLDCLLRLLHPVTPFITEEIWKTLGKLAPARGITRVDTATESLMQATWPEIDSAWDDPQIEHQFSLFQQTLGTLREIRSRQNIPPRDAIEFVICCDEPTTKLLESMAPYFASMANARALAIGRDVSPPPTNAQVTLGAMDVFVDLKEFIDIKAEIERNESQLQKLTGFVLSKENKLANDNFISRAPQDIVERERQSLQQAKQELESVQAALDHLRKTAAQG
jgi:valyl-tRNA synthetase